MAAYKPIVLPRELPRVSRTMTGRARVGERFFLNYCTFGYTMPWWRWADWERLIDWMALNGVTMPLAITGTEAVWQRVWRREGLTARHLARFFTGPAHLPWHRMLNINGWQGPLPQSWIDGQADLQRRILQREREFGMRPVLPAFNGSVPLDYKLLHPEARITEVGQWGGFGQAYRTYFLSPTDPRFGKLQKSFLDEQRRMFGTDHLYCLDSFNEVQPPSWSPDTLCMLARHIHASLDKTDPQSVWVQMGWLFYNDRKHWTPDAIRAYLSGIPKDRALLLDYYIDHTELWRLTESFYGRPYIACVLGNFGGNTMLQGDVGKVSSRLDAAIAQGGNMAGVGATMEASASIPTSMLSCSTKRGTAGRPTATGFTIWPTVVWVLPRRPAARRGRCSSTASCRAMSMSRAPWCAPVRRSRPAISTSPILMNCSACGGRCWISTPISANTYMIS